MSDAPPPWEPEIEPDAQTVSAILREQFPALAGEPVVVIGRGWDNTAYEVGGTRIFRFPRKESTVALLQTEAAVLADLASDLPLPIPIPRWVGTPSPAFPWPFLGYERLPGTPGHRAALAGADRARAAPVLGRFLRALHARPADGLVLPGDVVGRTDFARRLPQLRSRLEYLAARGVIDAVGPYLEPFAQMPSRTPPRAAVVHGDLQAAHFLFGRDRALAGVIDWGDVHLGDPGVDLMIAFTFLPPPARAAFFAEYGEVDEATLATARRRAIFHSGAVAWYGAESGDGPLRDEAILALRLALE